MRRDPSSAIRPAVFGLAALALVLLGPSTASLAQVPQPRVPDINERSGLLQRFKIYNFKTNLPKDPYRDNFYRTRVGDHAKLVRHQHLLRRRPLRRPAPGPRHAVGLPVLLRGPGPEHDHGREQVVASLLPQGRPAALPPAEAGRDVLRSRQLRPDLRPRLVHPGPRPRLLALVLPGEPRRLIRLAATPQSHSRADSLRLVDPSTSRASAARQLPVGHPSH